MGTSLPLIFYVGRFTIGTQSFNSLGQNPCTVVAYLMETCYGVGNYQNSGVWSAPSHVSPPVGYDTSTLGLWVNAYLGPDPEQVQQGGACWCNTVAYSLISACSECHGGNVAPYVRCNGTASRLISPFTIQIFFLYGKL